jgi:hypothetical protein
VSATGPPEQDTEAALDVEALQTRPEEQRANDHALPPEEREGPEEGEELAAARAPVQPIGSTCLRTFKAVHDSGTRPESDINHIIIHCTQGSTAKGAATWFANKASGGSAHLVVDDVVCYRTLDNGQIPWGAAGANRSGFHIEHAGFAEWNHAKWMSHEQTLRRGAQKAAQHAVKFGIPLKVLSADDLRRGRSGFVTHATVTQVFPKGNAGHHDPGPGFPLDHYMKLVKQFAAEIQQQ